MDEIGSTLLFGISIGFIIGALVGLIAMNLAMSEESDISLIPPEVRACAGYLPKQVEYDSYGDIIYVQCGEFRWER